MEVHHHGHVHEKKKWKEYLFQFLMLFLAVFCGFLAEYQLEHTIEHQREEKYMATMLEDLKSDTSLLNYTIRYWDTINNSIDSVADAIQLPLTNADLPKAYRHLNNAFNYYSFSYNDRTIAQLKNSGSFRLIRKKNLANMLILFDQFNNDAIKNIAEQHNFFYETVMQLHNKVFVQEIINEIYRRHQYALPPLSANLWIDSMIHKNKIPFLPETQSALMFEFKNALLAYRRDYSNMQWGFDKLKVNMDELIKLIHQNYGRH
jgi:hypothetical protein